MDVDEEVSVPKPKTPAKPGKDPEDVTLTHKTPAEIQPTVCYYFSLRFENLITNLLSLLI